MTNRHGAVYRAVKKGDLPHVTTQNCVDCGKDAAHYHHADHSLPLDLTPLCAKCHRLRHAKKSGHSKRVHVLIKVSEVERRQIKAIAAAYDMSVSEFVRAFTRYVTEYRPRLVIEPAKDPTP